jgi:hypothetical protein
MTADTSIEDSDFSEFEEEHYIAGSKIPNYDKYCPITKVWGYEQGDGSFLVNTNTDQQVIVNPLDFIENPGFLIIHLGHSVEREYTVEKAAQALNSSLTSLFAACDIPVHLERIRTSLEFSEFMKVYRGDYSNLILIGHGSKDGIRFLDRQNPTQGSELSGFLGYDQHQNKLQILSLCCHSGCESISKALSLAPGISEVIAPSESFDLRWAVHFVVGYFLSLFINNSTIEGAIRLGSSTSRTSVCIWRNGVVETCIPDEKPSTLLEISLTNPTNTL